MDLSSPGRLADPSRQGRSTATLIVLAVWILLVGLQLILLAVYGVDVPYKDDWGTLDMADKGELTTHVLWRAGNHVHRLPLPGVIQYVIGVLSDWDFRAPMLFNAGALAALSALWIVTARRIRGRTSITDAIFPLLLLRSGMVYQVLFGFQLTFMCGTFMLGTAVAWLAARRRVDGWGSAVGLSSMAMLLPLCGANGLLAGFPIAVWLAVRGIARWRSSSRTGAPALAWLIGALGYGIIAVLYMQGLSPGAAESTQVKTLTAALATTLRFLSTASGPTGVAGAPWSGVAVAALAIGLSLLLSIKAARSTEERWRYLALLALGMSFAAMAVGVAFGRGGGGERSGYAMRYYLLTAPLGAWLIFVTLRIARSYQGGRRRWPAMALQWTFLAALVLPYGADHEKGMSWARAQHKLRTKFKSDIHSVGWLDARLATRQLTADFVEQNFPLNAQPSTMRNRLPIMQRERIGPYRWIPRPAPLNVLVLFERSEPSGTEPVRLLEWGVDYQGARMSPKSSRWLHRITASDRTEVWPTSAAAREGVALLADKAKKPFFVVADVSSQARDTAFDEAVLRLFSQGRRTKTLVLWIRDPLTPGEKPAFAAVWQGALRGGVVDRDPLEIGNLLRRMHERWSAYLERAWRPAKQ